MFILEEPYVSELMIQTIKNARYDVLLNEKALEHFPGDELISDAAMATKYKQSELLYTNSENSIAWIAKNLPFSPKVQHIETFKNKYRFREMIKDIYPDFYFREVAIDELDSVDISQIKKPFIIKPRYGFLSIGVFTIHEERDWIYAVQEIKNNIRGFEGVFPREVISTHSYIIEEYIKGDEYAVDAYFDSEGNPVILNILEHIFSSGKDVSDRLYITSRQIIESTLEPITRFLKQLGDILNVKNFPIHIELRKDNDLLLPIEVNPMRFAGWCTTDIAYYAYGINPYEYFMEQKKPDWESILARGDNKKYSVIVLDKPREIPNEDIANFDYEKLLSRFQKVIEFRKTDFRKYPLFGFIFTETDEGNEAELENMLMDDLKDFISSYVQSPGIPEA